MEFQFVLVILPLAVLTASIIGSFFVRQWYLIPFGVFAVLTTLTFTLFNSSFFIWVIVFTVFSTIVSFVMSLIRKGNQGSVV
ncbi:DUF2651 domain-containing protein [Sporosarcina sp. ANT_H38]|uniref:DUF2651 family protein n=1 Tax=Sporosarcina sp. ANT_H38 TaxID=2597358 RepID=UPI0011F1D12B|nr:DUF2651 family protein [Sporosarcina sp. ANT_H38]KAA0966390.1 DUF2651 domain-containing protein [Sporosarcina sp. ANT_H38]